MEKIYLLLILKVTNLCKSKEINMLFASLQIEDISRKISEGILEFFLYAIT